MCVSKKYEKLLTIAVLLFVIQGEYLAAADSHSKIPPISSSVSLNEKKISTSQSGGRSSSSNNYSSYSDNSNSDSIPSEENFYPFTLSSNKITAENVAGLRIKGEKIILFGFNNTCSTDNLTKDFDFSDMNFFKQYPKLISVELNGLSLKRNVLENLQKFLPPTLKSLIIRSCDIQNDDNESFVNIIKKHPSLENIVIIFPDMSADESTSILGTLKINNNVKSLSLTFGKLSTEGSKHLTDLIINSAKSLQELSLGWITIAGDNNSYKNITNAILKIKKLQKLEISVMSLSDNDIECIANAIGNMKHLLALKIFFGDLNKHDHIKLFENAEILQQSLVKLKKLDMLDLSDNGLPSEVIQLIAQAISSMQKLKTINLSGNIVDEKSAESLSDAIKKTDSITTLIANECKIDDKVFAALCKSLSNTFLMHLYFKNNKIKEGAKNLPIASMPELYVVDFSQNEMGYGDVMAFIESIKGNSRLSILNFNNNSGIEEANKIEQTIKRNQLEEWRFTNCPNRQISIYGL
ncbi:MAG: hypothetical protein LBQ08_04605 [Holosporaceae bacterium]|jgi:Ran GTPase-activating protein (RanGAP) involved in mRNA processing and transport|nr:hypothetical protein [Holosporaceae bacterium]